MATASSTCVSPSTCGAPVTEEPGLRPRSPNIVVGPVLVTVEPASTEKLDADSRPTVAVAPRALLANSRLDSNPSRSSPADARTVRAAERDVRPARAAERRLGGTEPLERDSYFCVTPTFIGVSSLRRRSAAYRWG